jgi:hypothetical protein
VATAAGPAAAGLCLALQTAPSPPPPFPAPTQLRTQAPWGSQPSPAALRALPARRSGNVHGAFDNDLEALAAARKLLGYLPLNSQQAPPTVPSADPASR